MQRRIQRLLKKYSYFCKKCLPLEKDGAKMEGKVETCAKDFCPCVKNGANGDLSERTCLPLCRPASRTADIPRNIQNVR